MFFKISFDFSFSFSIGKSWEVSISDFICSISCKAVKGLQFLETQELFIILACVGEDWDFLY